MFENGSEKFDAQRMSLRMLTPFSLISQTDDNVTGFLKVHTQFLGNEELIPEGWLG